jgi:hypothetical protein
VVQCVTCSRSKRKRSRTFPAVDRLREVMHRSPPANGPRSAEARR